MVPIGDARRRFGFPWVTSFLTMVLVTGFLIEHFSGMTFTAFYLKPYDAIYWNPWQRLGGALLSLIPQGLTWLAPLANLVYFWVLGRKVEDACGSPGFLVIGLLGGVGGVACTIIVSRFLIGYGGEQVYGLAGVVAALMGAYMVLYKMAPIRAWIPPLIIVPVPAVIHFLYWAGLEFLRLDMTSLQARTLRGLLTPPPQWPYLGAFLIGLAAGHLFARRELLFYRTLRPEQKLR